MGTIILFLETQFLSCFSFYKEKNQKKIVVLQVARPSLYFCTRAVFKECKTTVL